MKSVGGVTVAEADVEPWGLAGDRRWMLTAPHGRELTQREQPRLALVRAAPLPGGALRLTAPGHGTLEVAVPPREHGTIPVQIFHTEVAAVPAAGAASAWFSAYLGAPARLVHMDAPERRREIDQRYARPGETVSFADGHPLQLAAASSLDALNSLIAQGDHAGEGPLPMDRFRPNLVVAGTAPWEEDGWRRVRVGGVVLRVARPCGRCVVTTTDQATAERGKEPLRTLARHRRSGGALVFGQLVIPELTGRVRSGDVVEVLE